MRDLRIGMTAARLEHLERIESYHIRRVELVILDRSELEGARRYLDRTGARLSIHCPLCRDAAPDGYPLLAAIFDTDADRQARSLALIEAELRQAAEWGATHVVAHLQRSVGILGEAVPPGWSENRALDAAVAACEQLLTAADAAGVSLHVENMLGHPLFARPESYARLFEMLPHPRLAMCFDIGHAALDAAKFGFDLVEFAALMAPRIGSLHVYANQVVEPFEFAELRAQGRLQKHPVHPEQSPEQGWIPVAAVLDAVLSRNPQALVTFEVYYTLDCDRDLTRTGVDWAEGLCRRWWAAASGR